jgi:hypothetical protein
MKRSMCSLTIVGTKTKQSICSSTIKGTKTNRSIRPQLSKERRRSEVFVPQLSMICHCYKSKIQYLNDDQLEPVGQGVKWQNEFHLLSTVLYLLVVSRLKI